MGVAKKGGPGEGKERLEGKEQDRKTESLLLNFPFALGSEVIFLGMALLP